MKTFRTIFISSFLLAGSIMTWAYTTNSWSAAGYSWSADFNGDGKMDVASANGKQVYMYFSTGVGLSSSTWSVPGEWGSSGYTRVGDLDGDGRADILSANDKQVYVH